MTDGKPARITSFSHERGFGRVAVQDEGELVFDAGVASCSAEDLAAGNLYAAVWMHATGDLFSGFNMLIKLTCH